MAIRKLRVPALRLAFCLVGLLILFVRPRWPAEGATALAVEVAGYLLLLAGCGIRMWSILYLGGRKSKALVTQGPYSVCKNPLYVGTFLLAVGAPLCFENLAMLLASVLVVLPIHGLVAQREERHLEQRFGEEYVSYQRRVRGFLPRFCDYCSPGTVEVSLRAVSRMAMEIGGFLMIPVVEDILELLHNHEVIPVLWHFP